MGSAPHTNREDARADLTPWGESFDNLADVVLNDKSAPPFLALAAFLYKHGQEREFRSLIAEAVALNEAAA